MNKLTGPRQTVEWQKEVLGSMVNRRRESDIARRRAFRSYTNDLARAAKTCQAAFAAKIAAAEQKLSCLVSLFINRAAGLAEERARLHVCMQTVSSGSV
jgi:hypothetical protein